MSRQFFRWDPFVTIVTTFVIVLGSQIIASLLIGLYPSLANMTQAEAEVWWRETTVGRFIFILIAEAVAVGMVYQAVKWAKLKIKAIGLVKPKWKDLGWAVITYGVYFLVYFGIFLLATNLLPIDTDQKQEIGFDSVYTWSAIAMAFASLVILPPLAEEIIFRGLLFSSMRAKYKFWTATIITSIPFGIAHLQLWSGVDNLHWLAAIDTFVLSFFLCYVREKSGSLWPAIFLHALKNFVAFSILFGPQVFILIRW